MISAEDECEDRDLASPVAGAVGLGVFGLLAFLPCAIWLGLESDALGLTDRLMARGLLSGIALLPAAMLWIWAMRKLELGELGELFSNQLLAGLLLYCGHLVFEFLGGDGGSEEQAYVFLPVIVFWICTFMALIGGAVALWGLGLALKHRREQGDECASSRG